MGTTLITGGTVVSATGRSQADVLIDGETIVAVLQPGSELLGTDVAASVDTVIDATGKYVIPGGIDAHTHMELPFGGTAAIDTFETGTRAAAWGGTTSIIDFAVQRYGERMQDGLAAWHAKAAGNCAIDYGFHQIIGGVDDDALAAMPGLIDEGITSFKLFMAYPGVFYSDDAQVLKAMQVSRETGLLTMMHAENGPVIDVLAAQLIEEGKTDPYFHGIARAWQMEEEATHRAIMIANLTGAPLYVVHVSAKQAVEQLAAARDKGQNVFGETCPQYLYLSLEEQLGASSEEWGRFEGAKWVCSTPLRSRAEGHQDHMWQALRTNDLQMVSTDHCPFCMKDQKELGRGDFRAIPNGIGSIEHRMDLMYQGVVTGKITLERWVELTSTTPARMFGLYGRKGVIQPGADADIVVYDPNGHTSIGVGQDPSHEHGSLGLGGLRDRRSRRHRALARQGRRRSRRVPRLQGRRPLPQARPQPVPDVRITMDFGVVLQTNPPAARTVQLAKLAEAHGFNHVWTFDSHLLWQEPYVIHSAILAETNRVTVGPFVTNPATRDWTVTASVFATLNEMYGNRTICGIGRGDSAVRVTNGKPVTMRELRESIHVIRELANSRPVEYNGATIQFPWSRGSELDVWVAAYGPLALKLTGEVGDGFILQLADLDIAAWMIKTVRDAAANVGRDPDSIAFCVAAPMYIGEDWQHMRDQCRWFGGMVGNHVADIVAKYGHHGEVPEALTDYISGRTGYDYNTHGKSDNDHVDFVPDEIIDRFCILGTADEHIAKLKQLHAIGVTQFAGYLQHDNKEETMRVYGETVIPALTEHVTAKR